MNTDEQLTECKKALQTIAKIVGLDHTSIPKTEQLAERVRDYVAQQRTMRELLDPQIRHLVKRSIGMGRATELDRIAHIVDAEADRWLSTAKGRAVPADRREALAAHSALLDLRSRIYDGAGMTEPAVPEITINLPDTRLEAVRALAARWRAEAPNEASVDVSFTLERFADEVDAALNLASSVDHA